MALIKLGALAQDVRGSLAGTTFSRNKGGSYARQKVSPTQPRTDRQLAQRAILSTQSKAWGALSATNRALWNQWCDTYPITNVFGDSIKMSGLAGFVSINGFLATCGLTTLTTPPAAASITGQPVVSITATASSQILLVTLGAGTFTGLRGAVYCWPTATASITNANSKLRFAGDASMAAGGAISYTPSTTNPKLAMVVGQTYHVLIVQHDVNAKILLTNIKTTTVV